MPITQDEYARIAPYYDFLLAPFLKQLRNHITTYINYRGFKRILDLCCGTGQQLRLLEANGRYLCGIDSSMAMLEQARKTSPETIDYHFIDAEQEVIFDDMFDCVIISLGLHEKRPGSAQSIFSNARRCVKPGGSLIVADYSAVPQTMAGTLLGKILIPCIERLAGATHYASYREWIQHGGLEGFLDRQSLSADIVCHLLSANLLCCALTVDDASHAYQQSIALLEKSLKGAHIPDNT